MFDILVGNIKNMPNLDILTQEDYNIINKYKNNDDKLLSSLSQYFKHINNQPYFSISHKKQYCVYVGSSNPIGVDLEYIDNNLDTKNYSKNFSYIEKMYIKENKVKFLEVWTMKESLFKLTNKLISVDPFNKTAIFNNKEYKFESKLFNKKYILTICY